MHKLFRMAKSILHHDVEVEDAIGETICKAYSRLDSLRSLESFKPWVMKILINEYYGTLTYDLKLRMKEQIVIPLR